ncbi:class F sortase [Kineococcus rhizosphaerae]|uniref:Sortase family protein n=1 Tax=Kineococcus rhizosphaerae TaxID=559628 RepID=A0A2T0R2P6_9ACTN|nr:class F sortase [Kineococcus rhizosphaerae]PRY14079.1 sortase family protein [Kineococcus rhizosphaerae]
MRRPERTAHRWNLLAAALAVTGTCLSVGWWTARPAPGFGQLPVAAPAPAPPTRTPTAAAGPVAAAPVIGRTLATPTVAPRPPAPVRLEVPSLGVDAEVVAVGVRDDGAMELPEDPRRVGWYRWGPVPGQEGNAVLAGHVDTRRAGAGALLDLASVEPGALVRVTGADGAVREFHVTARVAVAKEELPTAEVFARQGPARLVVITCGGPFDRASGRYEQNVVVTAG